MTRAPGRCDGPPKAQDTFAMVDATPGEHRTRAGPVPLAVGAGIFLSRVSGLVRERVLAHYLGLSAAAGAFRAALRIPNLLQNLLGEGVLSASFIPVLRAAVRRWPHRGGIAGRGASVGTLLAAAASVLALVGVLAARPLVGILAPGFDAGAGELTVLAASRSCSRASRCS